MARTGRQRRGGGSGRQVGCQVAIGGGPCTTATAPRPLRSGSCARQQILNTNARQTFHDGKARQADASRRDQPSRVLTPKLISQRLTRSRSRGGTSTIS